MQEQNNENRNVDSVLTSASVSSALAGLVSEDTLSEIKSVEKTEVQPSVESTGSDENNESGNEESNEKNNEGSAQQESQQSGGGKEEEKKEAAKERVGVFGIKKPGQQQSKNDQIEIDSTEKLVDYISKKYGRQDIKDVKDVKKFFETTDAWREDSQKLKDFQKQNEDLKNILENLPDEFITGIRKFYNGEDYMEVFQGAKSKIDFSKPVDKQDKKDLVDHYFPGKFSEDDFSDTENISPALEIAIQASTDKFLLEKKGREDQRALEAKKAQEKIEKFNASIESSVGHLKQSFPDVLPEAEAEVKDLLSGGSKAILDIFFNNDGTLKPEAAEMVLMARYGREQMSQLMEVAAHQAETKVMEDVLSRTPDSKKSKSGSGMENVSPETQKLISDLGMLNKESTF